ncbi:hypothetical protein M9458_053409, partial [Cirrhinus mrigala]
MVWDRPRCRHVFLLLGSSHPRDSQESGSRPITHCKAVSTTAGSDGSCVQSDTFWPAVHETPTVMAQDQGVLPKGKFALHDQGHAAMPTCLGHVEETLVLVSGPGVGSSLPPRNASDGRVPHRLGSGHEWPPRLWSVERSPSCLAHQLPGDAGHVSDYLAVWKLLPNVSAWVLRTVERGCRQFGALPPPFKGVFLTLAGPEQGLVMEQEVDTIWRKEAIEVVPPHDRESGFCSQYYIVPKKDGGLRPILDLRQLNRSVMRLKFRMLTVSQVVSQTKDWFVTIDLKDVYFHVSILPQHRKFLRFAFRGEAYQYRALPFGLAFSPRTFTKAYGGSTLRCCPRSDERVGVETEHQEESAVSITENHLSRRGVGFNHDAGMLSTAQIESILTAVMRVKEGQSLTVKQFQRLLGLMAAASNVIPFGLLYTPTVSGCHLTWHIYCLEMLAVFSPRPKRLPCVGAHRQHSGGLLHQPPGRSAFAPLVQASAPDPCVVRGQTPLAKSSSCSWASQHGSRHPVEAGAKARGMDASPRVGEADLESVWPGSGGPLRDSGECAMSPLVLSDSSSSPGAGCHAPYWPARAWLEVMGVAPEGAHLVASGLSTEVVETILQYRAPSTRKLYALKWRLFTSWCEHFKQDPVNCPVGTVLEFLQDRFFAGLAHSILKVYMAAFWPTTPLWVAPQWVGTPWLQASSM